MKHELKASDIKDANIYYVPLGDGLNGYTHTSQRLQHYIFIEEALNLKQRATTIAHEIYHLKYANISSGIGLDEEHDEYEINAKKFAIDNEKLVYEILNP